MPPDAAEIRRRRATGQLLGDERERSPHDIVGRLLAVQAQELHSARRALRARGSGFSAADVNAALDDGSLVIGWLMRGTLHLVRREDYHWLLALTAPRQETDSMRRLGQEGVSPSQAERGVEIIERALVEDGPLARPELAERLARGRVPAEGQAVPHLLWLATRRGVAVRGPLHGARQLFAAARDWLGEPPRVDRDSALVELARRYVAARAPATPRDLAYWAGLPLRDVRDLPLEHTETESGPLPPRLLPRFDEYMLSWKDRSFAVPAENASSVHPGGGLIHAVGVVDGLVVATWSARRQGKGLAVEIEPLADTDVALFDDERDDLERFED